MSRHHTRSVVLILLGSTLLLGASPVFALAIFTDRTAWENAVSGTITTDTFSNNISQADSIILDTGIVSSLSGTQFIGSSSNSVDSGVFVGFVNQTGCCNLEWDWSTLGGVSAIGGDFFFLNVPNGLTVTGDFDGTGDQTISVASTVGTENGFFGLIGASVFDTVIWSSNDGSGTGSGEFYQVDNFSFAVPEPSILTLLGIGFAGLGYARRRKPD